jgi:dipeptidyl-peptidase 4
MSHTVTSVAPQSAPAAVPKELQNSSENNQTRLTIDRIFGPDSEFKPEVWGPAHWLKNGTGYTTLEVAPDFAHCENAKEIKDIVHYDPATGARTILVAAADLIPAGQTTPLILENYAWTEDASKLLLFTNAQRMARKNSW